MTDEEYQVQFEEFSELLFDRVSTNPSVVKSMAEARGAWRAQGLNVAELGAGVTKILAELHIQYTMQLLTFGKACRDAALKSVNQAQPTQQAPNAES